MTAAFSLPLRSLIVKVCENNPAARYVAHVYLGLSELIFLSHFAYRAPVLSTRFLQYYGRP